MLGKYKKIIFIIINKINWNKIYYIFYIFFKFGAKNSKTKLSYSQYVKLYNYFLTITIKYNYLNLNFFIFSFLEGS